MNRILLFIFLFTISFVYSQDSCELDPCSCSISINRNFFNDEIIGFYLSSIDLESGDSSTLLFDYSIDLSKAVFDSACNPDNWVCQNGLPEEACMEYALEQGYTSQHGIDRLYLDFNISMFIPDFMDSDTELVSGEVKFDINSSSVQKINFRNTDLNFDTSQLAGNTSFSLESYEVNITDEEIEEITNLFLSQGRAPNGVYTFNFIIKDEYNNVIDNLTEVVEVFVPSFLDLISPGSPEIADSLSNLVMTSNPIFQWNSDYCNKCDFNIRVSEFKPTVHSSMQEALDDYSILPLNNDFFSLPSNINSFQYPNSGSGEIMAGKLYVWQIMRSYTTSNGLNKEFSPIYLFKMQSMEVDDIQTVDADINLENIKLLIGNDIYNSLFNEGGPLNDYNNVSGSVTVDNQSYSINYLIDLINKKNQGDIIIIEVGLE